VPPVEGAILPSNKKTMLMLRKNPKVYDSDTALELRHQRSNDVIFDVFDSKVPNYKPNHHIYSLIETLLPNATDTEGCEVKLLEL
jgi:hypothetical protein